MTIRRCIAALLVTCTLSVHAAEDPDKAGTTIVGDQDAALGLYLLPWKEERPSDMRRAPGMHDEPMATVDGAGFSRTSTYYATGRAYRAERLQRNR